MDFHPTLPMQGFTAVVKRVLCALVTTVAVLRRGVRAGHAGIKSISLFTRPAPQRSPLSLTRLRGSRTPHCELSSRPRMCKAVTCRLGFVLENSDLLPKIAQIFFAGLRPAPRWG